MTHMNVTLPNWAVQFNASIDIVHEQHKLPGITSLQPRSLGCLLAFCNLMSVLDVDRAALRSLQENKRISLPPTSLSSVHISDALRCSTDNGATLDFAKKNLTDVGESGAEELATIGREEAEDESSVLRYAGFALHIPKTQA
jgi:hypothetical protein